MRPDKLGQRLGVLLLAALLLLTGLPSIGAQAATPRRVTAWIPYWDQPRALASLLANADLYSAASPFWYELAPTGAITAYAGGVDPSVVATIHGQGIAVIPTISNAFDPARVTTMLASATTRAAHVRALTSLVTSQGYDGMDVDYESLAATDRARFTSFVTELAASLHPLGKQVTVAVHPKTSEPGTWSGPQAQDYAALGAVADRIRVMAYDYSWDASPAGPIAPLAWVDQVAAFAAQAIPPAKVELGMNLYGYDWVGSAGTGITYEDAVARMTTYAAPRTWDAVASEPSFRYSSGGVAHTAYYADAQSVAARLAVADRYGLAGAAFWRLGGEDPAVWPAVRARWGAAPSPTKAPHKARWRWLR